MSQKSKREREEREELRAKSRFLLPPCGLQAGDLFHARERDYENFLDNNNGYDDEGLPMPNEIRLKDSDWVYHITKVYKGGLDFRYMTFNVEDHKFTTDKARGTLDQLKASRARQNIHTSFCFVFTTYSDSPLPSRYYYEIVYYSVNGEMWKKGVEPWHKI